jgi:NitT/TauT family transport system ATP-binding protein
VTVGALEREPTGKRPAKAAAQGLPSAHRADGMAMIEFSSVSKRFVKSGRPIEVLEDITFEVRAGEFSALVGPSGCGKSTLLNMAAGLVAPSAGQVRYGGQRITNVNTRVGYVTQRDNLLPWRSVRDNVELALEIRGGFSRSQRKTMVATLLDRLGLTGFEDHFPAELSGGMRKRVTLARTLIYSPESMFLDEPFGALDAQLKLVLQDQLLHLWEESHKTVLFVTHDLPEAIALADRVIVLSARPGRIKAILDIDLPRPRDAFRVRFTDQFQRLHELLWNTIEADVITGENVD